MRETIPPLLAELRKAQEAMKRWRTDDEYDRLSDADSALWDEWCEYANDHELCLSCAVDTSEDGNAYCPEHREP